MMKIEMLHLGFSETIDNGIIDKIVFMYPDQCTIFYHNNTKRELTMSCSSFNSQDGIPVSKDSKKIFVGYWDAGLYAYDIETGKRIWKFRPGRIRRIFVYPDYLIVVRDSVSVNKIDINTGELLEKINSGTIVHIMDLGFPYVLADTMSGKYCIIDVEKMTIVKKYSPKIVNPNDCLAISLTSATLENNILTVSGQEQYPHRKFNPRSLLMTPFPDRVIDTDFYNMK